MMLIRATWLAHSLVPRVLIGLICVYALLGSYAIETLPLSSPTPPSWYHHPAIVIPGFILTLPAVVLTMLLASFIPRDGGPTDLTLSSLLSSIGPSITIAWCISMFFLLNCVVRRFERPGASALPTHHDANSR